VLGSDGLGLVAFGDPVAGVMATLTDFLGAPSRDEIFESPFDLPDDWQGDTRGPDACHAATVGNVCFDYVRLVGWDDVGLFLLFSDIDVNPGAVPDDDDYWIQVPPSLRGYGYSGGVEGAPFYTADGVTVDATAADLMSLGDRVSFNWTACGDYVEFTISDEGELGGLIRGTLDDHDFEAFEETGLPNENAKVESLGAGQTGSC
jgi:hypothetical protein